MARVVSLIQLKVLGSDPGGLAFADFFELFAVEVVAHRLRKSGQKDVDDSQAIALAFDPAIDEP